MHPLSILILSAVLFFPSVALAQDNVIRVVQPDGSVVEFRIPDPAPPPAPPEPSAPSPREQHSETERQPVPAPPAEQKPAGKPVTKIDAPPKAVAPPKPVAPKPVPTRAESEGRILNPEPAPLPVLPPSPGQEIPREQAIQIALRDAPPALSMSAVKRTFEGRLVWVVSFRTEEGMRDVLVDTVTGEIVFRK